MAEQTGSGCEWTRGEGSRLMPTSVAGIHGGIITCQSRGRPRQEQNSGGEADRPDGGLVDIQMPTGHASGGVE